MPTILNLRLHNLKNNQLQMQMQDWGSKTSIWRSTVGEKNALKSIRSNISGLIFNLLFFSGTTVFQSDPIPSQPGLPQTVCKAECGCSPYPSPVPKHPKGWLRAVTYVTKGVLAQSGGGEGAQCDATATAQIFAKKPTNLGRLKVEESCGCLNGRSSLCLAGIHNIQFYFWRMDFTST